MKLSEIQDVIDREKITTPVKKEVPLNEPGGFTVVILNDPVTPAEVVVEAIMHATGLPQNEAFKRMMNAHQNGWVPIASYSSKDIADTVASKIETHAYNNKNYDHYKQYTKHNGPWPLTAEVMQAGE